MKMYTYVYAHTHKYEYKYICTHEWAECMPMAKETKVHSKVESYQGLKKWYLILSCLSLSTISYALRLNWSNPGKGVTTASIPWCSSY